MLVLECLPNYTQHNSRSSNKKSHVASNLFKPVHIIVSRVRCVTDAFPRVPLCPERHKTTCGLKSAYTERILESSAQYQRCLTYLFLHEWPCILNKCWNWHWHCAHGVLSTVIICAWGSSSHASAEMQYSNYWKTSIFTGNIQGMKTDMGFFFAVAWLSELYRCALKLPPHYFSSVIGLNAPANLLYAFPEYQPMYTGYTTADVRLLYPSYAFPHRRVRLLMLHSRR